MADLDLNALAKIEEAATPGPWFVNRFDDEHFMSAISLEAHIQGDAGEFTTEVIAATLIQQPAYVVPSDGRFTENADLIAAMRNALPELLRLAKIGQSTEHKR